MKLIRLAVAGFVGAGLVYGAAVTWSSPPLKLRRIEVAGNEKVSKDEVAAASGLVAGVHLLTLSTADVSTRVEALPWIRTSRVERIIPSKVRITVTERQPAAEVLVSEAQLLVDREGVVLETASGDTSFVKIADLPTRAARPGDRITLAQLREALEIFEALDPEIRMRTALVRAATVDRITLELEEGTSIIYGAGEKTEEKNFAIKALLAQAETEGRRLARIDVRVPKRPAVILR